MRTKIRNKKQWLEIISSAAAVVILYAIMYSLGITCPIKWLTGVSCAGCGMTRAWLSVLRLDFKAAFYYHPLFFTVPFAAAVICLGDRLSKKLRYGIYGVLIFLFIAVYIYRMLYGDGTIVTFRPSDGAIEKILKFII